MSQSGGTSLAQPFWKRALGMLGIVTHVVVGYFYLAAGLVTPMPWLIGFWVIWILLLFGGIWLFRRHPLWVLLLPVVSLGILIGGVSLGGALLGWTA